MKIHKKTTRRYEGIGTPDGNFVFKKCTEDLMPWKTVTTYDSEGKPFIENEYYDSGTLAWCNKLYCESADKSIDFNDTNNGSTFKYQYDPFGNVVVREIYDILPGKCSCVDKYSYDGYGNMITLNEYTSSPNGSQRYCYRVITAIKYQKTKDETLALIRHTRPASRVGKIARRRCLDSLRRHHYGG